MHNFQGNWGKHLLQEGLSLLQAAEGCSDVRHEDASSILRFAKNTLEQAILQAAENEKVFQVL